MSSDAFASLVGHLILDEEFRKRFFRNPRVEMASFDLSPGEEDMLAKGALAICLDGKQVLISEKPDVIKSVMALQSKCGYCCNIDDFENAHRRKPKTARVQPEARA